MGKRGDKENYLPSLRRVVANIFMKPFYHLVCRSHLSPLTSPLPESDYTDTIQYLALFFCTLKLTIFKRSCLLLS